VAESRGAPFVPHEQGQLQREMAFYYALISIIDEQIGRVLAHLRKSGEAERTVIVYTTDHGDFAGDHGLMGKVLGIYESIHRVPLILAVPGGPQGQVVDGVVESIDLHPTLCRLMGAPVPAAVEGRSLLGDAAGGRLRRTSAGREEAFCEALMPSPSGRILTQALRTPRYRLVLHGGTGEGELYDHRNDLSEVHNCFDEPARAPLVAELRQRIRSYDVGRAPQRDAEAGKEMRERRQGGATDAIHRHGRRWSEVAP
jgi:arylsulfatase A-like enzyme